MIDIHCHLLPGLDDGPETTELALEMARVAVDDGITEIACTPHIVDGQYANTTEIIHLALERLRAEVDRIGLQLKLHCGADIHLSPRVLMRLVSEEIPSLAKSRYFLLEPPHHVVPQGLLEAVRSLLAAGFIPVITHPERLTWVARNSGLIEEAVSLGSLLQITAGSLLGHFGDQPRRLALNYLLKGQITALASDGHNLRGRRPVMSEARKFVASVAGELEADRLTRIAPGAILSDAVHIPLGTVDLGMSAQAADVTRPAGFWKRLFS